MIGNSQLKPKQAFSLIEVIISVTIFSVIIMSTTNIFRLIIDAQRSAIASQNVQESLKYFLEVTGKEIRMAKRSDGSCGVSPGDVYRLVDSPAGDALSFKNYYDECVIYSIASSTDNTIKRFRISRNAVADFISPEQINIDRLDFVLDQDASSQPLVTINLKAHSITTRQINSEMTLQTSLSSRYYKAN